MIQWILGMVRETKIDTLDSDMTGVTKNDTMDSGLLEELKMINYNI